MDNTQEHIATTLLQIRKEGIQVLRKATEAYENEIKRHHVKKVHTRNKHDEALHEAFSSIMQFMKHTAFHCEKYYRSLPACRLSSADQCHCVKYHHFRIS